MSRLFFLARVPRVLLFVILASLTCTPPSRAQTAPPDLSPANSTGVNPYETYAGERENINLGTGDLNIQLPLLRLPGRNGQDVVVQLAFDSRVWQLHGFFDQNTDEWNLDWEKDGGWAPIFPQLSFDSISGPGGSGCNGNYRLTLPDGSKQSFPNVRNQCNKNGLPYAPGNNIWGDSRGALFTRLSVPATTQGGTVVLKDGSKLLFNGTTGFFAAEDSNGNTISYSPGTITDTAGHVITVNSSGIQYKDSNGQNQTITFNYSSVTIAPTFSQPTPIFGMVIVTPPFPNCSPASPCTWSLISSIVLPSGLSWTFQYDAWGEVTKITYPTGGYTRYDYGVFTGTGIGAQPQDFREITAKHSCASSTGSCSTEDTTTYSPTINSSLQNNQYMDVTDPLGNLTHYEFSIGTSKYFSTREINRKIYQGSTTLLETIHTDYNNLDTSGNTQDISLPIRVTRTLNDTNQVSKVESDYDSYTPPSNPTIDNVIEQREYDYASGAPGSLVRKTDNTWLKTNSINSVDYTQTAIHILNRKASTIIYNAAGTQVAKSLFEYDSYTAGIAASSATQHDSAFGTSYTTRGNTTAIQRWRNTDGALLTTRNQFDDAGNVLSTTDPLGNTTSLSYADNFTDGVNHSAKTFVTQITHPVTSGVNHIERAQYFYNSGLPAASCGQNFPSASSCANTYSPPQPDYATYSYDLMNRRTQINLGDGGQATTCFSEVSGSSCYSALLPVSIVSTQKATSTLSSSSKVVADGLARSIQTQLTSDPQGTDYTDKTYDSLGRVSTVSNPYRSTSDPTYGITTTQYDVLNRPTKLIPPDGSSSANNITTSYSGNCTTVTDQAGKSRKSCTDALGRLTQVFEDPAGLNYETDYTYDALNNLLTVNQKGGDSNSANWRTRTFTYNSLSQLLNSATPESGTATYVYDNDGNLTTKTSPAPNQTGSSTVTVAYCYDALNRLTSKAYTTSTTCPQASPVATYLFDQTSYNGLTITNGIDRRTGMTDPAGAEAWSFDMLGRPLADRRTTNSVSKTTSYTYNLDGSVATLTYLSGRTITYSLQSSGLNTAGRMLSAVDTANSINYATAAGYTPTGALSSLTNGGSFVSTLYYNSRLQACRISAKSSGTAPTSCTDSTNTGNVLDFNYNFNLGSGDNGNVGGITNNRVPNRSQSFTYDPLNRIATAQTTSTHSTDPTNCWGEAYFYDNNTVAGGGWGNLTSIQSPSSAYTGCTQESGLSVTANNKNQLGGYTYDAAGNEINDGLGHAYTFTTENQLLTAGGATYTYDGDGKRVQKSSGKLYWYGMSSEPITETDASGNLTAEYVFFNGKRTARRDSSNNVFYYFADHLGTSRTQVQAGQTNPCYDADFYPFGGERTATDTCDSAYKFTGKERDGESGLDNFGKRYFGSSLGRFMTPDPLLNSGQPWNPQSWNRYAYTENNPMRYTDPTGLYKFGNCSGTAEECLADEQRFRDSITKAQEALKGLDPNSKEAKALKKALDKLGDEDEGNIKINFGYAGSTNGLPNLANTFGNNITINYDAVDKAAKDSKLNAAESAALDAGVTTHEGTHAFGSGLFGFAKGHFEHPAYYTESVTYQGLHNTDKVTGLWNESWLAPDKDKLSVEQQRESAIQNAIHPPKQEKKQENPQ